MLKAINKLHPGSKLNGNLNFKGILNSEKSFAHTLWTIGDQFVCIDNLVE